MGLLFSRVGTDSFYSGLDNQFKKISANVKLLQEGKLKRKKVWNSVRNRFFAVFLSIYICILAYAAWIIQQPAGTYSPIQHAKRVAPAFISPILAYAVYSVFSYLQSTLDKRADDQIKKHEIRLKKMISDLKDTTKYQKTLELLEKYDPEYQPTAPQYLPQTPNKSTPISPMHGGNALTPAHLITNTKHQSIMPMSTANRAATVAATAVTGAGIKLSAALGQLWTQAADTLIADDPTLIAMLEQAQAQAAALERENIELRSMLGVPPRALDFNGIAVQNTTAVIGDDDDGGVEDTVVVDDGGDGGGEEDSGHARDDDIDRESEEVRVTRRTRGSSMQVVGKNDVKKRTRSTRHGGGGDS